MGKYHLREEMSSLFRTVYTCTRCGKKETTTFLWNLDYALLEMKLVLKMSCRYLGSINSTLYFRESRYLLKIYNFALLVSAHCCGKRGDRKNFPTGRSHFMNDALMRDTVDLLTSKTHWSSEMACYEMKCNEIKSLIFLPLKPKSNLNRSTREVVCTFFLRRYVARFRLLLAP